MRGAKGVRSANTPGHGYKASSAASLSAFDNVEKGKHKPSGSDTEGTSLQDLLKEFKNLDLSKKVQISGTVKNQGGYSDVCTGIYTRVDGIVLKVAIKKFRVHVMGEEKLHKVLAKELRVWSTLEHRRILRLEGFYVESRTGYPHLISEWMDNGTASKYLAANPNADVLLLIVGIAEGVSYLHSRDIIHSDLKPDNVLISDRGEPLLSDFGVSRMLSALPSFSLSSAGTTGIRGTLRYISKEIFLAKEEEASAYSKASDVWAFGMTILALVTRKIPYCDIKMDVQAMLAIVEGKLPSWPVADPVPEFYQKIQDICKKCWAERIDRKRIEDILEELRNLEQSRRDTLQAFLQYPADLNLAGKVRISYGTVRPGGYSDIFIGNYDRGDGSEVKVAVRRFRVHIIEDRKFEKALAQELRIWSKLKHPRILPLEGFYIEDGIYPHIVSRWVENGNALEYLKNKPGADVLSLIIGIAEGIQYLHSEGIVHSNIKPDNVMISDDREPLLCDFGVSRMLSVSPTFALSTVETAGLRGTIRYISKEILRAGEDEASAYTKASDVWAFGMTILALATKNAPYSNIQSDVQVMLAIVDGKFPAWPTWTSSELASEQRFRNICAKCWLDEWDRSTIGEVLAELRDLQHNFSGPRNGSTILTNGPGRPPNVGFNPSGEGSLRHALAREQIVQKPEKNETEWDEGLRESSNIVNYRIMNRGDDINSAKPGHTTLFASSKHSSNKSSRQPIPLQKESISNEQGASSCSRRAISITKFIPRRLIRKSRRRDEADGVRFTGQ